MSVPGYKPSYRVESPYRLTSISGPFMAYYVHRSIDPHPDDIPAVIDAERYVARPDLLATDLYGDPHLWWVFGVRNGLEDPVFDLKLGTNLYIPTPARIKDII